LLHTVPRSAQYFTYYEVLRRKGAKEPNRGYSMTAMKAHLLVMSV
jgi:hypothetical protein